MSKNERVLLVGRLGNEPEMRYTASGMPVTTFNLATTRWRSKEKVQTCPTGWKESYKGTGWEITIWWRVSCWRELAEMVNETMHKGEKVECECEMNGEARDGKLAPRIWTGKDGIARASFEVTAWIVKPADDNHGSFVPDEAPPWVDTDDMPF